MNQRNKLRTEIWAWPKKEIRALVGLIIFVVLSSATPLSAFADNGSDFKHDDRNDSHNNRHKGKKDRHHRDHHDNEHAQANIILQEIAASAWDDGKSVGTQMFLQNVGEGTAKNLQINKVSVEGGIYQGPAVLPAPLGDVAEEENALFDAILELASIDSSPHLVTVEGSYRDGTGLRNFRLQKTITPTLALPGPFLGRLGRSVKQNPLTASFPPSPPAVDFGPNAESPIFVPIGPPRQIFPPTPDNTIVGTSAGGAQVEIPRNTSVNNAGVPPDPSTAAASADGVVLMTYNTGISFSTNGGQIFTDIPLTSPQPGNPARTSFFPQSDGGLCCDQVVVYLPNQNLFVWLLQYNPVTTNIPATATTPARTVIASPNRLRIAWATPAAIAADFWNAWTYADLTGTSIANVSDGLGVMNNEWMDYPDLAWSDNFLYVGVDHGFTNPGAVYTGRRIVVRMSLTDMANPAATTVAYRRAELTGSNGLNKTHFVQHASGRMVVGSLDNSSTMRIFTWADNSITIPSPAIVPISRIAQGSNYTSVAPDGADWVAVSFPGNITGAAFRAAFTGFDTPPRQEYVFAFDAGANAAGGRPQSYVRLQTLLGSGASSYSNFAEYDIWNSNFAFAMAVLDSDIVTEIGMTLALGGGTIGFPQMAVGYRGDFLVYQVTNSNATQTTRFGDYFATRQIPNSTRLGSSVYDVILNPLPPGVTNGTCATVGCTARARFIQFGRPPAIIE